MMFPVSKHHLDNKGQTDFNCFICFLMCSHLECDYTDYIVQGDQSFCISNINLPKVISNPSQEQIKPN